MKLSCCTKTSLISIVVTIIWIIPIFVFVIREASRRIESAYLQGKYDALMEVKQILKEHGYKEPEEEP